MQLNSTTLLYPLQVNLTSLPDAVNQCKLWVTLWGPPVDMPDKQHLLGMKECLAAHPDIPDEALQQNGKILQHVGQFYLFGRFCSVCICRCEE